MTDKQLYTLCKKYGRRALLWRQKFLGLLPEANRRKLYEKKGCSSIFEFAAKLAGVSHEQVRQVLNLEKRLETRAPELNSLLVSGKVSVNKLIRVASIATFENQNVLARYVKQLPKSALDTLVRDEKNASIFSEHDGSNKPKNEPKSLPGQELHLSPGVHKKLLELQQKGIDINKLLEDFLQKREMEIAQEKEKIVAELEPATSKHIPVQTQKLLQKEHGTKCAVPLCQRTAQTVHHTDRFALSHRHDPRFLAPLCADHHKIAHAIDEKYWKYKKQAMSERESSA